MQSVLITSHCRAVTLNIVRLTTPTSSGNRGSQSGSGSLIIALKIFPFLIDVFVFMYLHGNHVQNA